MDALVREIVERGVNRGPVEAGNVNESVRKTMEGLRIDLNEVVHDMSLCGLWDEPVNVINATLGGLYVMLQTKNG